MHRIDIPAAARAAAERRAGRRDVFERIDPRRTALLVVDMQNYFVAPEYPVAVPLARELAPAINRLAGAVRAQGGLVAWIYTSADGADRDWSHLHAELLSPEASRRRLEGLAEGSHGYALWHALRPAPGDAHVVKRRYSAFMPPPSPTERLLRERGIDTVLVAGTATNVCCESTARDAMMLDFRSVMIADANAALSDADHNGTLTNHLLYFGAVWTADEAIAKLAAA